VGQPEIPKLEPAPRVRIRALLAAQALAVFNDNALRLALALAGIASVTSGLTAPEARAAAAQTYAMRVFVVFTLPLALMSIPAGVLADRIPKRSVIVATKAVELGLLLAAIPALAFDPGGGAVPLAILAALGVRAALLSPAKYGILPELLPEAQLSAGNGRLELWTFLGILGGTYAGGLLLGIAGGRAWVVAAVLAALAGLGLVAALRIPRVAAPRARGGLVAAWRDATAALRADRLLSIAVVGTVAFWTLGSLVNQDLLVYAKVVLGLSDAVAAVPLAMLAVGIGVGGVLAGRIAAGVADAPLERGLIPLGAAGIAVVVLLLGLSSPALPLTLALTLALGVSSGLLAIPLNVLAQWRAPAQRRGAVIAVSNTFVFSGVIAGSLGAGALGSLGLSPAQILVVASAGAAACAAAAFAAFPGALRAFARRIVPGHGAGPESR
jgi:acyl-[acyl-carrier-protein]-phospholipid O-acyltransferase/long-chain-fatty-acid--[acyl-carrier-protein] ligase